MQPWRRTLYVLWAGQFLQLAGVSLIAPFLPLYLGELGVQDPSAQAIWSGIIFSSTYVAAALFQPVWGDLGDRYGRKPMALRSAFGLALAVGLFAVARNPWWLLGFRLLQGVMAGYSVAATALMSAAAPQDKQGYALGFLQTGYIAGTVCGPLFGGLLAQVVGHYRPIFLITTVTCGLAGLLTWIFVPEERKAPGAAAGAKAKQQKQPGLLRSSPVLFAMIVVTFMANFAAMTVEPTLTLFLKTLSVSAGSLQLYAGVVFAATGIASFLAAPRLGRLGDRIGHRRVLTWCLSGGAIVYLAQGFVTAGWQLAALRFALGLAVAGIVPAAQAVIARVVPAERRGRGFGYTLGANFWGNVIGPVTGSAVAAGFHSMRAIFPVTAVLMLINLVWLLLRVPARLPETAPSEAPGA